MALVVQQAETEWGGVKMDDVPQTVVHIVLTMESGGLETVVYDLCNSTDRTHFRPEILCLQRYDVRYLERLAENDIPVTLMKKHFKLDIGYFFRVARFLRQRHTRIVHAHSGCFFYAALFALLARCHRMVYTAHGLPVLNRLQDKIEDNLAGLFCQRVLAVSDEVAACLKKRMPLIAGKIECLTNGIDTYRFRPFNDPEAKVVTRTRFSLPADALLFGSVGRLAPEKNYQLLLRAFAQFQQQLPELKKHLVFIGDGLQRRELEILRGELGLDAQVTFLGNQCQVEHIMPMLDVFVLSSLTEGTSISLLEAQSCGVPAVATDVGGNGNVIITGLTGLLSPSGDVDAMADRFICLATQPWLRDELGKGARQRVVEDFSLQKMVNKYAKVYYACSPTRVG